MKNYKKLIVFAFLLLGIVYLSSLSAQTKMQSYYSGDAVYYNYDLFVASTDSESLELFVLQNDQLEKVLDIRPFNKRFNQEESFYDVVLSVEDYKLYAYVISGFSIYKYDVSDPNNYSLVNQIENTYWEWYNHIDKFGDYIITTSAKGVNLWNKDLVKIDNYVIENEALYNISAASNNNLIFNLHEEDNLIKVFNKDNRAYQADLNINFYGDPNRRGMYFDSISNNLYVADDLSVKKIGLDGSLRSSFEHLGFPGYDVASSGNDYLYFANGIGLVKLNKSDLSLVSSVRTGALAVDQGWAMGVKAVNTYDGERVVVFNNSSIMILDADLSLLAYHESTKEDVKTYPKENLFLNLSNPVVDSGNFIELSGGGFLANEDLEITLFNSTTTIKADDMGRFATTILAPSMKDSSSRNRSIESFVQNDVEFESVSERTDISVLGLNSDFSYSISVTIHEDSIK